MSLLEYKRYSDILSCYKRVHFDWDIVSIIFVICEELMAITTTIINVCMVVNNSYFSLFYSPRNREIIEIDQEYQFFSLFRNHKE